MATLLQKVVRAARDNDFSTITMTDWAKAFSPGAQFNYNGQTLQAFKMSGGGYGSAVKGDSPTYACEAKRVKVFSEARFQFQNLNSGATGSLFGTPALTLLEEPWPGATTQDLLAVAEMDYATRGNSYWVEAGGYLLWLDPCKVKVITEAWIDPVSGHRTGEQLLGYAYVEGPDKITYYAPTEIAHYKPVPDPDNRFVGISWIGRCLPDIDADMQMTAHKQSGLTNGASLNYVVTLKEAIGQVEFQKFVAKFRESHDGPQNAGKTAFLDSGADLKTIGQTFENLELRANQGATETRIAACSGVSPVIVGLSEGLAGSSLNAGNYGAAKRNFVDSEMRTGWRALAGALQWLIQVPAGARLWYDDDIPFLREDILDQAEILAKDAQTARTLLDAGYEPDAVVDAIASRDMGRLTGRHSGLFSVQLQRPGSTLPTKKEGAA